MNGCYGRTMCVLSSGSPVHTLHVFSSWVPTRLPYFPVSFSCELHLSASHLSLRPSQQQRNVCSLLLGKNCYSLLSVLYLHAINLKVKKTYIKKTSWWLNEYISKRAQPAFPDWIFSFYFGLRSATFQANKPMLCWLGMMGVIVYYELERAILSCPFKNPQHPPSKLVPLMFTWIMRSPSRIRPSLAAMLLGLT